MLNKLERTATSRAGRGGDAWVCGTLAGTTFAGATRAGAPTVFTICNAGSEVCLGGRSEAGDGTGAAIAILTGAAGAGLPASSGGPGFPRVITKEVAGGAALQ